VSLADFDRFVEKQGDDFEPGDLPALFAEWLAQHTGDVVIGGPVEEPPTIVAVADEDTD
jgi:hypothetical protein